MASRILGEHVAGGPFGKPLPDYTVPELDFVLEMAALDEPDRWKFTRVGQEPQTLGAGMIGWREVLAGEALREFDERTGKARAMQGLARARARTRRNPTGGMRPGLTRAGKPMDSNVKGP
jgi:hypothetical protein